MAGNYLLFLGPTLFLFFALEILPLIMGIGYSFTDWNRYRRERSLRGA